MGSMSRRDFLATTPAFVFAGVVSRGGPAFRLGEHPEPRPGIDASLVLTAEDLPYSSPEVHAIFAAVREMPHIADGIGCYCGCALRPGYRSLLTCYYEEGMAAGCPICQGEAKLVHRRWKEGQTLDQIRRAIDARFA